VDLVAGMLCATVGHLASKKLIPAPEKVGLGTSRYAAR